MPQRLKRWERQEVFQISQAWVEENCHRVTDRDVQLGRLLLKRKLLRRDQIEVLHAGFRGLANPEVQINRRLRVLFDSHFIDRVFPNVLPGAGSSQAVIALDRAGAIVLDAQFKPVIRHQKDRFGNIARILPINYRHTLGVNDFEVSLVQWCFSNGAEILRWRLDFENVRRFSYNGEWSIRPDGFGIVKTPNGKGKAFFFEYDTGTEDVRYRTKFKKLTAKFKGYAAYKSSGAWMQEDWASKLKEFPVMIFLSEDKRRIEPLRELAATMGLNSIINEFENRDSIIKFMFDG